VLIEAVVVVLAVSFISLGLHKRARPPLWKRWYIDPRPGLVVGITIPLVLAATFLAMWYWGIGLHKISLGSLIIALGLLVDDAIIAVEMMVRKMEEGYDKPRRHLCLRDHGHAHADRHADHGGRLSAHRHGQVHDGRIHLRHLCGDGDCAGAQLGGLGVLRALPGHAAAQAAQAKPALAAADPHEVFDTPFYNRFRRRELVRGAPLADHRRHGAGVRAGPGGHGQGAAAVLPGFQPPEILVDLWFPEGTSLPPTRPWLRVESASCSSGVDRQRLGGLGRAALSTCRWTRCSRRPTSRSSSCWPGPEARERCAGCRRCWPGVPEVRGRVKLLPNGPPVPIRCSSA
jgi:hypothetical protein